MAEKEIPEENIEINGKLIGTGTTIKLSIKTALWIMGGIVSIVLTILIYSYFSLKSEIETKETEFVKSVNEKVEKMKEDLTNIRLNEEDIKGDIKLILDRQDIDNPISNTGTQIHSYTPPVISNIKDDKQ